MKQRDIEKRRKEAGLSQVEMAKLIGKSAQTISNWECFRTEASIADLAYLEMVLGARND